MDGDDPDHSGDIVRFNKMTQWKGHHKWQVRRGLGIGGVRGLMEAEQGARRRCGTSARVMAARGWRGGVRKREGARGRAEKESQEKKP